MEIHVVKNPASHDLGWMRLAAIGLLAVVAICLLGAFGLSLRAESASEYSPTVQAGDVQVVAASLGRNLHGLYLVDRARETICVYQYVPRERKLKLTAVRRYAFDTRLDEKKLKEAPIP
jgi:hypothetical protein